MKLIDGISDACKIYGEEETNDHIFACKGQSTWRLTFYTRLYKHLVKTSTESYLTTVIMQGLRWQHEDHDSTVAIDEERKTAPNRLVSPWQENHIQRLFPADGKKRDTAKMWSVYFIDFMFTEGYERWKAPCDKVHEKVKRNEMEQARHVVINSKVTALYTVAMDMGYRDRHHIFSKSLEDKLKESVYQLQRWVAITTPAVKQAAHDFKRRTKAKMKDIRRSSNTN
jgi:hypothetical protein